MANFVVAAKISDIAPGVMHTVMVQGKKIALANVDGQYFAVDDTCTHEQCSLGSEGFLDGNVVTCGCHGAQFDVTSGKVVALPAPKDVSSYQTKVEGENVLVGL